MLKMKLECQLSQEYHDAQLTKSQGSWKLSDPAPWSSLAVAWQYRGRASLWRLSLSKDVLHIFSRLEQNGSVPAE